MHKCAYGCNQIATFILGNGKYCCSNKVSRCPVIIDKTKERIKCDICGNYFGKTVLPQHKRTCQKYKCSYCGEILSYKKLFCNTSCSAFYNNLYSENLKNCRKGPRKGKLSKYNYSAISYCQTCGKVIKGRSRISCSQKCGIEKKQEKLVQQWLANEISGSTERGDLCSFVRSFIIKEANYRCSKCGWDEINPITKKVPLELHHIDGWWKNNKRENLEVLCPNCHSLTPTFRNSNKGNGRDR